MFHVHGGATPWSEIYVEDTILLRPIFFFLVESLCLMFEFQGISIGLYTANTVPGTSPL